MVSDMKTASCPTGSRWSGLWCSATLSRRAGSSRRQREKVTWMPKSCFNRSHTSIRSSLEDEHAHQGCQILVFNFQDQCHQQGEMKLFLHKQRSNKNPDHHRYKPAVLKLLCNYSTIIIIIIMINMIINSYQRETLS